MKINKFSEILTKNIKFFFILKIVKEEIYYQNNIKLILK